MELVRWESKPRLRRPVLIAAFEGWSDAGEAASGAVSFLSQQLEARPFARIEPEEFYDFTETRPTVRLIDGVTRTIDWPEPTFSAAPLPGADRDVILLGASEPHLKWRTFTEAVLGIVQELKVEMFLALGALLSEVPHTRPVRVIGTSADPAIIARLNLQRSRYEGPTGILGVLSHAVGQSGIDAASLWASVPHYLPRAPSPKASLALVERALEVLGAKVPLVELEIASAAYERQVSEAVAEEEDVAEYVRRLEEDEDEEAVYDDAEPEIRPEDLPSGDELAADVERFLRDQRDP